MHRDDVLDDQFRIQPLGKIADEPAPFRRAAVVAPIDLPVADAGLPAPENALGPIGGVPCASAAVGGVLLTADPYADALPACGLEFVYQCFQALRIGFTVIREFGFVQNKGAVIIRIVRSVIGIGEIPPVVQNDRQILAGLCVEEICPAVGAEKRFVRQNISHRLSVAADDALRSPSAEIVGGVGQRCGGNEVDLCFCCLQRSAIERGACRAGIEHELIDVDTDVFGRKYHTESYSLYISKLTGAVDLCDGEAHPTAIAGGKLYFVPFGNGGLHPSAVLPVIPSAVGLHAQRLVCGGVEQKLTL